MQDHYDRSAEDLGNIVALEHVNTAIADQRLATLFYVSGLGLTRDPYLTTGVDNMWINVGRSQFHLPTGEPQVLRGHVGLVVPERDALLRRLFDLKAYLDGSRFSVTESDGFVEVTSPWGNRFRCYEPSARFGPIELGMPYLQLDVPPGAATGIARFYSEVFETGVRTDQDDDGTFAGCKVGDHQELIFRETDAPQASYDGHHIQVYLANFSSPHARLASRGLVFEESSEWQYRFRDIVDLESSEVLFTLEHEVRSMTHPLYGRKLVNRNPLLSQANFALGHEELPWHVESAL